MHIPASCMQRLDIVTNRANSGQKSWTDVFGCPKTNNSTACTLNKNFYQQEIVQHRLLLPVRPKASDNADGAAPSAPTCSATRPSMPAVPTRNPSPTAPATGSGCRTAPTAQTSPPACPTASSRRHQHLLRAGEPHPHITPPPCFIRGAHHAAAASRSRRLHGREQRPRSPVPEDSGGRGRG